MAQMGNGKSEPAGNKKKDSSLARVFLLPAVCAGLADKPVHTMGPENAQVSQKKPEHEVTLAKLLD